MTKTNPTETPKDNARRSFLKLAAAGAPAAAVAGVAGSASAAAPQAPVSETKLQDTAHTRAYYEAARF